MNIKKRDIKVVVTGATGFVGRHVINVLEEQKIPYVAIGQNSSYLTLEQQKNYYPINILSPEAPKKILSLDGTHLIHLAWIADHGEYWYSTKNHEWVLATLNLVRSFKSKGHHVTAIGTCAEYDWNYGSCIENSTPLKPSSIYGNAKVLTSFLTQEICKISNITCSWIRLFIPFGLGENPNRLIPSVADAFLKIRPRFPVGNENWRDFLAIEDVADAIVYLTLNKFDGAINVCSGTPRQIKEIVAKIGQYIGAESNELPDIPKVKNKNPHWIIGDNALLRKQGWQPKESFEKRLTDYLEKRNQLKI